MGKPATRLGDLAQVPACPHGCPACPHPGIGPAISGSPNVFINNMPAHRMGDNGIHAVCCGPKIWKAQMGSVTVKINNQGAMRQTDMTIHCGSAPGQIMGPCSPNVFIGD